MTEREQIDLKSLIREVLAEHDRSIEARHPEPGPHTYVDDTGHGWLSYTIAKGSFVQKLAALITAIVVLAGLVNTGLQKMVVEPAIHQYVDVAIRNHEAEAEKLMEKVLPTIALKSDLDSLSERVTQQDKDVKEIKDSLVVIQADIKELLKRRG